MRVRVCSLISSRSPLVGELVRQGVALQTALGGHMKVFYLDEKQGESTKATTSSVLTTWTLPGGLVEPNLEITAIEEGGCGSGKPATVVCLPDGRSLTPFLIRGRPLTALFSHRGPIVTVTAKVVPERPTITVDAWHHSVNAQDGLVTLMSTRIAHQQRLARNINCGDALKAAVRNAIARATCPGGCSSPHYVTRQGVTSRDKR